MAQQMACLGKGTNVRTASALPRYIDVCYDHRLISRAPPGQASGTAPGAAETQGKKEEVVVIKDPSYDDWFLADVFSFGWGDDGRLGEWPQLLSKRLFWRERDDVAKVQCARPLLGWGGDDVTRYNP
jgi:hypothetical protein